MAAASLETARTVVYLLRHRDISFLAGSVAFFAFLSLIPTMVLVLAIGSLVGGEQFATRVVALVDSYLSEQGSAVLTEALADSRSLASVSAVSLVVLLWSSLKVFRAIDIAFDRVYRVSSSVGLLEQLRNGLVALLAIAVGLGLLLAAQTAITELAGITTLGLFTWPIVLAGLVIVLFPLYYILPPVRQPIRLVLPGTLSAVVGLVLLRELFQIYATQASQYQAYGFIGAVLLFLLWLYFGALILIFGAIINAAIADEIVDISDGDEPLQGETPKTVE